MNPKYVLTAAGLLLGSVVLAGCTAVATTTATGTPGTPVVADEASTTATEVLAANEDYTTVNDDEWSTDDATAIDLDSESGTVTITGAGTYVLSGSLDGQVVVTAPDDALVAIVLDNASISSTTGPAISVESADDVVVSLTGANTLSDAATYADDADANAALFSEADLTITGDGSLTVTGNGNDGITSEDDLVILSGTVTVTAADDGLRGKDSLVVEGGTITVTAGGDGLKADNEDEQTRGYILVSAGTVDVTAGDDAFDAKTDLVQLDGTVTTASDDDALHADVALVVDGGTIDITRSYEGLEAATIAITGGTIDIVSSDDGINASSGSTEETGQGGGMGGGMGDDGSLITISGGDTTIDAEGDGFDSNGSAVLTGGTLTVDGPTGNGNGALDVNGTLTVDGGTVLAIGSSGMAVAPGTDSAQSWISAVVSGSAGDTVTVADADGGVILEYTAVKAFGSVVYSSAALQDGATYTVSAAGSSVEVTEGTAAAGGGMGGGPGGGGGPRP